MAIKYAVFDWNGTLFEPATDEGLNRAIAYARLNQAKDGIKHLKLWKAWDAVKLLRAKKEIGRRLDEYNAGQRPLADVYEPFNRLVVRGMEAEEVYKAMFSYIDGVAREARRTGGTLVDPRMAAPLPAFEGRLGILSTSQINAIQHALWTCALSGSMGYDDTVANRVACNDGIAEGLTLDIYGRKAEAFEDEFLRKRGFEPKTTVYAGDTSDDMAVADLLPRGRFVVPFYATEVLCCINQRDFLMTM